MKKVIALMFFAALALACFFVYKKDSAPAAGSAQAKVEAISRAVPEDAALYAAAFVSDDMFRLYFDEGAASKSPFRGIKNGGGFEKIYSLMAENISKESGGAFDDFISESLGGFVEDYERVMRNFGFVAYIEKPDEDAVGKNKDVEFAAVVLLNTDRLPLLAEKIAAKANEGAETPKVFKKELAAPAGAQISVYVVADGEVCFYPASDRLVVANSEEMLLKFLAAQEKGLDRCILDNPEFKKLSAEADNPMMSVFVNLKSALIQKIIREKCAEDKAFAEAEKFMRLGSFESCALFAEEPKDLNFSTMLFLASASEENGICETVKASKITQESVLKTSPKDTFIAMSVGLPFSDEKTMKGITGAMDTSGALTASPLYGALENNLKQINFCMFDMPSFQNFLRSFAGLKPADSAPSPLKIGGYAFCDDAGKILNTPELMMMLAQMYSKSKSDDTEIYAPKMPIPFAPVLANLGNRRVGVFTTGSMVEDVKFAKGEFEGSMADNASFKRLSYALGSGNSLEFYMDYMLYFGLMDMQNTADTPEEKQAAEFMKAMQEAMKEYKIAFALSSSGGMLRLKGAAIIDVDYEKYSDAFSKMDWGKVFNPQKAPAEKDIE